MANAGNKRIINLNYIELDSGGFRTSGIRFNTIQTVGTIYITSLGNTNLKDQTNREGLVHNKAYDNLRILIKSILKDLRNIIEDYYPKKPEKKGPVETEEIHEAITPLSNRINNLKAEMFLLSELTKSSEVPIFNSVVKLKSNVESIEREYLDLQNSVTELDAKISEVEKQQRRIFDLAGIGMTAETVAHEMKSYLGRINSYLVDLRKRVPAEKDSLTTLLHNTRALEVVVSRLDLQSITKRRSKARMNLVSVVREICDSKLITWNLDGNNEIIINIDHESDCFIKANQGMIVQVFDNLLNNSHYWLLKHKKENPSKASKIHIRINSSAVVEFSDNGTGITHGDARFIFEPFFTRKIDGEGRGLGLYIVSQILSFHNADIYLSDEQNEHGNYYKFIIDLSETII
ncbi:sensor histidine kinase [Ferviditalea candida]|uniref:histidine kinase n=1 Tax=Ferviditalea candida TaxID=3108399 RepID=A0ABU5ZMK1_9BACL|nr:ATP-binding protein [Paenibacillaceae bacterium T2]